MEEKELWMNKLKEKLEDYSEPIPASGWEQLEKELMPPVERKIYPYRKWMMAAAAVILLALVSSVSLYFLGTPAADEIRHTQTPALASVPDALPAVQQPDAQGATADPVSRPMLKTDRLAKTEHNISELNTYTDQPVIQNEDEFPATDDKIDNGEKEETKLVKDANAGQKSKRWKRKNLETTDLAVLRAEINIISRQKRNLLKRELGQWGLPSEIPEVLRRR